MTRSRPVELEFVAHDDAELLARMAEVVAKGTGWINVQPVIEEEHEPPPPGPFAFLGGSTHHVPTITWMPGKRAANGTVKPTTVGLQHASGPRVAWRLRDLGCRCPTGGGSPRTIPAGAWWRRCRPRPTTARSSTGCCVPPPWCARFRPPAGGRRRSTPASPDRVSGLPLTAPILAPPVRSDPTVVDCLRSEGGTPVLKDFKDFLLRGNLIDLAVAVVVGVAFTALVNAFVKDLITPLVAAIVGKQNFDNLYFTVNGSQFAYGSFLNALLSFVLIATVIFFLVVKPVN